MHTPQEATPGLTARLVAQALQVRHDDLPDDVRRVARDCLVDWLGCALAGYREPASRIVAETVLEEGGAPQATMVGIGTRVSLPQAALFNGTASHALDYDDVNLAVPGHLGVAIIPGLLALAEHHGASGAAFVAAFVAGYETACRIGALVEPAHYANGFHATATIGGLGAAVACSHLLGLSADRACHALGVAATQAAGLKAMFGSMAKPLHAGLASQSGLRAALLAQKGFESRADALECTQGFAQVHGADYHVQDALAEPAGGYYLLGNLFKFHAACYSTHAAIEAVAALRGEHGLAAGEVSRIRVVAGEGCVICNIASPATALEAKFSLRAAAAFALLGIDTGRLDSWERVNEAGVRAVLDRVRVELVPGMGLSDAVVTLEAADGRTFRREVDCGTPLADKATQSRRVAGKFLAVASPVVGEARGRHLLDRLQDLDREERAAALLRDARP